MMASAQSITLGSCTTRDGGEYNGEMAQGKPNGKGKTVWKNGNWYEGDYVKGKRQGQGTYVFSDGERYEGQWVEDHQHGQGTYWFLNNNRYEGLWYTDYQHGQGVMYYYNGDVYDGIWYQDKRQGQGRYTFASGSYYQGEWQDDMKNGKGLFSWSDGSSYDGEWLNNKKHGKGTYKYATGDVYLGDWADDLPDGRGIYRFQNGDIYEGDYKQGERTGNGIINYQLASGNPDQYKLSFSDSAFVDTNWQSITTAGQIVIDVPAGVEAGTYDVTIVFGDSRFPQLVSTPVTVSFNVNLPETYTMPLFSDVIALVDTCHCFTDIHWFHRANSTDTWTEILEAQGQYYYQEEGGLTGEYYVRASMNGLSVFTCPQTDVTTLIADEQAPETTVSAYPNPATDRVTLRIEGSVARMHTLRVMNVMGLSIENRVFEGNETSIDLRGLHAGNYVVSVDGIVVRVIKK